MNNILFYSIVEYFEIFHWDFHKYYKMYLLSSFKREEIDEIKFQLNAIQYLRENIRIKPTKSKIREIDKGQSWVTKYDKTTIKRNKYLK